MTNNIGVLSIQIVGALQTLIPLMNIKDLELEALGADAVTVNYRLSAKRVRF